ncbi:MAG: PEP-CTERM sorting domain-containing protein [Chthoniobacteraceae bacterium]
MRTTPYNVASTFTQSAAANTIASLVNNSGQVSLSGATATANSASAASIDATKSGSWTIQEGSNTANFGFNTGGLLDNTTNISSGSYAISDLYELQPSSAKGPATYLGYFSLSNAGVLTFTAAPEPSSIALALLTGAGALMVRRRRA